MTAKGIKLSKLLSLSRLGNGIHPGLWSGAVVTFTYENQTYQIDTDECIRGTNIPCTITIDNDNITITI